jgi:hypothetical protein
MVANKGCSEYFYAVKYQPDNMDPEDYAATCWWKMSLDADEIKDEYVPP